MKKEILIEMLTTEQLVGMHNEAFDAFSAEHQTKSSDDLVPFAESTVLEIAPVHAELLVRGAAQGFKFLYGILQATQNFGVFSVTRELFPLIRFHDILIAILARQRKSEDEYKTLFIFLSEIANMANFYGGLCNMTLTEYASELDRTISYHRVHTNVQTDENVRALREHYEYLQCLIADDRWNIEIGPVGQTFKISTMLLVVGSSLRALEKILSEEE